MITQYFSKFIKTIMMTTPFLTLLVMLLALWGVVGKATYAEHDLAKQNELSTKVDAKSYLMSETANPNECNANSSHPGLPVDNAQKDETLHKKYPQHIDWSKVI